MNAPVFNVDSSVDLNRIVDDNQAENSFRVHRQAFYSDEVFELEKKAIFEKCWLYLGHASEVSNNGDFVTRNLAGRPIIFCRDDTGSIKVFLNTCTHRGSTVCREKAGNSKVFRCFYHNWSFRNNGDLVSVPGEEAYSAKFDKAKFNLAQVRFENYRGFVFICFDPSAIGLEDYLAGAKKYIDAVVDQSANGLEIVRGTQLYSMRANWKMLIENTVDFYHTVPTHTSYFDFLKNTGADVSAGVPGRGYDVGNGHVAVEFKAAWGRPVARWEPSWGEEERVRIEALRKELVERLGVEQGEFVADTDYNVILFPNTTINNALTPLIRQANPIAPGYMEVTQWAIAPIGDTPTVRKLRLHAFNTFLGPGGLATPDDVEALEGCHRGFAAHQEFAWNDFSRGYERELTGNISATESADEHQLRAYYRHWWSLLMGQDSTAG